MIYCSRCGAAQQDGAKFCSECGAPLQNRTLQIAENHPQAPNSMPNQEGRQRKKRKPLLRRWWVWVLLIVVIVSVSGKRGILSRAKNVQRQASVIATPRPAATTKPAPTAKPTPVPTPKTTAAPKDVTPEFKATMDSYEAFFDEFIDCLKAMADDSADTTTLFQYAAMMMQYADTLEKLEAIDESKLSPADDAYYIEVMARIELKLLEAAYYMQ